MLKFHLDQWVWKNTQGILECRKKEKYRVNKKNKIEDIKKKFYIIKLHTRTARAWGGLKTNDPTNINRV